MKILKETKLLCNSNISQLLYLGLVSDSNRFLFNTCGSHTFLAVSKLLGRFSIDLDKTYEKLYLRPLNEKVYLRSNSNVAMGGVCEDYTDRTHPSVIDIGMRVLSSFPGLPYVGID